MGLFTGASRPGEPRPSIPRIRTAVPRLSSQYLSRPRLLALLDSAAVEQLVVVCAPAGYGKTLLLADWTSRRPERTAWLTLDDDDNDDRRFWAAVLAASRHVPGCARRQCAALPAAAPRAQQRPGVPPPAARRGAGRGAPGHPRAGRRARADCSGPAARPRGTGQEPTAEPPTGSREPPRPAPAAEPPATRRASCASCAPPGWPSPSPRPRSSSPRREVELTPAQIKVLHEQTDGWAAALRLAAVSLREAADPEPFLADLVGNGQAVSDYLVGEILSRAAPRRHRGADGRERLRRGHRRAGRRGVREHRGRRRPRGAGAVDVVGGQLRRGAAVVPRAPVAACAAVRLPPQAAARSDDRAARADDPVARRGRGPRCGTPPCRAHPRPRGGRRCTAGVRGRAGRVRPPRRGVRRARHRRRAGRRPAARARRRSRPPGARPPRRGGPPARQGRCLLARGSGRRPGGAAHRRRGPPELLARPRRGRGRQRRTPRRRHVVPRPA